MKKFISTLAVATFLFSAATFAQEPQAENKEKAKTEKACCKKDKKSCSKDDKKSCSKEDKKACSTEKKACCAKKA